MVIDIPNGIVAVKDAARGLAFIALLLPMLGFASLACSPPNSPDGLSENPGLTAITISPDFANDGTLLIGTESNGVFKSTDKGGSWSQSDNSSIESTVYDIAISPSFDDDGIVYAATERGIFASSDRGASWRFNQSFEIDHTVRIAISPEFSQNRTLLATAMRKGYSPSTYLWRSRDAGASWSQLSSGVSYVPGEISFLSDGSVIGASFESVARSDDMGDTWSIVASGDFSNTASFSPNYDTDGIAFFSDNLGRASIRMSSRIGEIADLDFKAGFRSICHRIGYGESCSIPPVVSPTFRQDGTVFASAIMSPEEEAALLRSRDRGASWSVLDVPFTDQAVSIAISPDFDTDGTVFVATESELFRSLDSGDTWARVFP
jgi:photosystem II stability/assembly factor-like uncharacterized protein